MAIDAGKYIMEQNPMPNQSAPQSKITVPARPNEQSRLNIDEFLRITDPNSQQVFVEQRA